MSRLVSPEHTQSPGPSVAGCVSVSCVEGRGLGCGLWAVSLWSCVMCCVSRVVGLGCGLWAVSLWSCVMCCVSRVVGWVVGCGL